jgi:hypothetical protein
VPKISIRLRNGISFVHLTAKVFEETSVTSATLVTEAQRGDLWLPGQIPAVRPVHRHQSQPGRQARLRKHLEGRPLVLQEGVRHAEQNADHAVPASGAADRAGIAVDDDRIALSGFSRAGITRPSINGAVPCHSAVPCHIGHI